MGRGGERAVPIGPDHDVAAVNGEVHQVHGRQRAGRVDDPANMDGCQQAQAFRHRQLLARRHRKG